APTSSATAASSPKERPRRSSPTPTSARSTSASISACSLAMKQTLQVRLSQHLALTPQLQQSIRLLQLSTLELHQEVEQMLEQNPFLEAEEEAAPAFEPLAERSTAAERAGERETETATEAASGASDDAPGVDSAEFGTTEREDWENGTERDDFDGIRELPASGN